MDALAALLSSRVKAETFRLLFAPGAVELHVREIARRAGLNEATVRQELRRLTGLRLLSCRRDGNRALYRANAEHPLYPDIRGLVAKTTGLVDLLREAMTSPEIRVAFVFGSVAEGSEKPESDVDLMVIGELTLRHLTKLLSGVPSRLGREINPYLLTPREFARRRRSRDHFVTAVRGASKLFVIGDVHELEAVGR
jgi:DNA-binding transcriptional ArsR family regulator